MKKIIPVIGLMVLLFASCHHTDHKKESEPELLVSKPYLKDTIVQREYVCQIHAIRRIELRALERGYLQQIFVDEGQLVSAGQKMFQIMPNVYQADLQKYESEAKIAEIEYQNTKLLADEKVVSQNELALAKAKLEKAKAEVALAKTHLQFTDIRAPFNGIMDHLHAREGSLLEEGELLTTLSDNSQMWVYFNLPEAEYLNYMMSKDRQQMKNVSLEMANGMTYPHGGVVETIEGEFDHKTGNIQFRATFPNPERILRHGETGNILMPASYPKAILVPQKATFEVLDRKYVFVVDDQNIIHQREIVVAEELPHIYVVREGVHQNDRILIDGLRKVKDGQKIKVKFMEPAKVFEELELHAE